MRSTTMTRQDTCEARIDGYMAGRLETIAALVKVNEAETVDDLTDAELAEMDRGTRADFEGERGAENMREAASDALYAMPLAVDTVRLVKVTLGTGGPGDWFEAEVDEDGEIGRITYWFNDWFDAAHRILDGDAYETAAAFIRAVAGLD